METKEFQTETERQKALDLTSDFYILYPRDKEFLSKYYHSLVNDLQSVMLDVESLMNTVSDLLSEGKTVDMDLESLTMKKRDYAIKTITHMVTLVDFAASYSVPVRNTSDEKQMRAKIYEIAEWFIDQLGDDFWMDVYDNLAIDIEELVPVCHRCFGRNIENTLLSVRKDFPDFLNREL